MMPRKSPDLRFVLERVVERGRQSLARTPELLPILKQAGVVDSGGQDCFISGKDVALGQRVTWAI